MTFLEQIARAANPDWDTMSRNSRRNALLTARAHVEAMREPTEAMCEAAQGTPGVQAIDKMLLWAHVHGEHLPEEHHEPNSPLQQAWRAMIQSALDEPQPDWAK